MRFVDRAWVQARLDARDAQILDPRLRVRYTSGHLEGAIHVPVQKARDEHGRLLADDLLVRWLEEAGVRSDLPAVVYDQGDGQAGAMLAWILEYLGHPDVCFMDDPVEHWREHGGEFYYRPVGVERGEFELRPRAALRASWNDLVDAGAVNVVDVRSKKEFDGDRVLADDSPGHIPGATNLPWLEFVDGDENLLVGARQTDELLGRGGLDGSRRNVVYCRSGPRAAVVTLALLRAGHDASLYDGSWADWCSHGLPIDAPAPVP